MTGKTSDFEVQLLPLGPAFVSHSVVNRLERQLTIAGGVLIPDGSQSFSRRRFEAIGAAGRPAGQRARSIHWLYRSLRHDAFSLIRYRKLY